MFEILGLTFHWYGLLIGLGVLAALEIALLGKNESQKALIEKVVWWALLGGVIGARVYHVADYWSRYYSTNPVKIFYLWEGGLGIWGALGGGLAALLLFCYFNKLKSLELIDMVIVGVPLAQTIGRLGNYVNGELYGRNGEPLFAYEGILNLVLFAVLMKVSRSTKREGVTTGVYLFGYGLIRAILENLRPEEGIWKIANIPTAVIFGVAAMIYGGYLICRRKRS